MPRIYYNGTREQLDRELAQLGGVISGRSTDQHGFGLAIANIIGMSFLQSVIADFQVKMRGGCGEVGGVWEKLKPDTIARRRVPRKSKNDNEEMTFYREVRQYENEVYRRHYCRLQSIYGQVEGRRRARQIAAVAAKEAMGTTSNKVLSLRNVEILRDTGLLLNSLSPGIARDGVYYPPTKQGSDRQIFNIVPGKATVGTNREGAATHQYGFHPKNIPQRAFLPTSKYPVPESWWNRMRGNISAALPNLLKRYFSR